MSVRAALQDAVKTAMKQRDREALSVYRTTLAALDNAGAVGADVRAGAIEASPVGVGVGEVARRELTESDLVAIVRREAAERREAAASVATSRPDTAARLRHEADLLDALT